jgi:hypothetical protein
MQRRSMIGPESVQCWSGDQFVLSPLCFLEADPSARVILEVNGLLGIILKMILRLNLRAYTFFFMACIVLTPSRSAPTPRFFPVTFNPTPPQPPLQFTIPVPVQPRAGFRPPVSPARIDDFSRSSIAASPRAQGPAMLGGVDINQLANPRSPSLLPFDMPMSIRRMGSAPGTPTTIPLMEINQLSQVCFSISRS